MLNTEWKLESKSKTEQQMKAKQVLNNEQGMKSDTEWKLESKPAVEQ